MAQLNETPTRIQAPPRTADVAVLRDYVAKLADILALLAKDLDYVINGNLDVKNIRANSITADRMNVDELSAISANLGHIIAGLIESVEIYGSFIATSINSYPRAEMSSSNQMFRVMLSPTSYAEFAARAGLGAGETPALKFIQGAEEFVLGHGAVLGGYMGMNINDYFMISAAGGVYINNLRVTSWADIYNTSASKTLASELGSLSASISALTTAINSKANSGASTGSAGSHNHGIPDGTQLMKGDGTTVTWSTAGGHSHTQN